MFETLHMSELFFPEMSTLKVWGDILQFKVVPFCVCAPYSMWFKRKGSWTACLNLSLFRLPLLPSCKMSGN